LQGSITFSPVPTPLLPTRRQFTELAALALPVVTVQVGLMLMGVVDTMIVGRVSAEALAATALGNLGFITLAIVAQGILLALDPLVSQAVGAGEHAELRRTVQRGLVLALLLAVPVSLLLLAAEPVFRWLGQPAEVVPEAGRWVLVSIPGVFPFLAFIALRQTLQALGSVRAIIWSIVGANVLNAVLDVVLIFGKLGVPALGVVGSSLATSISRWVMLAALVVAGWPVLRPLVVPWHRSAWERAPLWRLLRLGFPIGLQLELELGAFGLVALFMGRLGTIPMAAHQVAINLASLTFMVPLGLGSATAALVGRAIGAGDLGGARGIARTSMVLSSVFMGAAGLVFLLVPSGLAALYTRSDDVRALAATLLPIAGVFQIADGLQAVLAGILRGAGDTRAAMIANFLGFWMVGVPVSLGLGFGLGYGAVGLWWGLVVGLLVVSGLLVIRARRRLRMVGVRVTLEGQANP
jgi:MATE family multidrug resistance protein